MGTQKPLCFLQKGEPGDSPPLTLCLSHVRPGGEGDPRQGDPAAAGPLASGREGVKPAGPTTPPYQARPSTVAMATSRPARPPPNPTEPLPRMRRARRAVTVPNGGGWRPAAAPLRAPTWRRAGRPRQCPSPPTAAGKAGGERRKREEPREREGALLRETTTGRRVERGPAPRGRVPARGRAERLRRQRRGSLRWFWGFGLFGFFFQSWSQFGGGAEEAPPVERRKGR